jgi:Helix-turn-helix domain
VKTRYFQPFSGVFDANRQTPDSTKEAAEYLGISQKMLRKESRRRQEASRLRLGERIYRFDPADLDAFERAIGKNS